MFGKITSHKDLEVWRKSMDLVENVYKLTQNYPKEELYGITSQIRRATVAIPLNITEGFHRHHIKEYVQFLSISLSSAAELETQVLICKSLPKFNGMDFSKAESLIIEIMKMLYVMIERIKER